MSDCAFTSIDIGGNLSRKDLDAFLDCQDLNISDEKELIEHVDKESGLFRYEEDSQPWGEFSDLTALCMKLGLSFIQRNGGHYTWQAGAEFWCPGMGEEPTWVPVDSSNLERLYTIEELSQMLDGDDSEFIPKREDGLLLLKRSLENPFPTLPPFRIVD